MYKIVIILIEMNGTDEKAKQEQKLQMAKYIILSMCKNENNND